MLKWTCKGVHKSIRELQCIKSKPKALRHFKVDAVLNINETFYEQAESMPSDILNKHFEKFFDLVQTYFIRFIRYLITLNKHYNTKDNLALSTF